MTSQHAARFVNEHRLRPAPFLDAGRNLRHLLRGMGSSVVFVRLEIGNLAALDLKSGPVVGVCYHGLHKPPLRPQLKT
jgi:hypothetical protein